VGEHQFDTLGSQTIYIGKIFALRADDVAMPGGGPPARREIIEHHGAVAVVALDDDENVTLVYQYRHAIGHRLWELPAGLLDVDGEQPQQTAARELAEEVGLRANRWQLLLDVDSTPGFTDESVRIYLATGLTQVDRAAAHDEEAEMIVRRLPLVQAVAMVFSGEIVNATAVAGLLAADAVRRGVAEPASPDRPWADKPSRFAARRWSTQEVS
jgi:ADP-ribose pyrophosphatase